MLCCVFFTGLLTTSFEENPRLKNFFKILALSLDNKGLPYISLMEAKEVRGQAWSAFSYTVTVVHASLVHVRQR